MFVLILVHNRGILTRISGKIHEIRNDHFFRQNAMFVLILVHNRGILTRISKGQTLKEFSL